MDAITSHKLGLLEGRLDGHDSEIGGLREQASRIEGTTGRIEGMLKQIAGSGPHVALRPEQPATEPITHSDSTGKLSIARAFLKQYGREVILAVAALLGWAMFLTSKTGRPITDFNPLRDPAAVHSPVAHDEETTWPIPTQPLRSTHASPSRSAPASNATN